MDQPLALRCGRTLNNRLCKVATSEHLGDARSNDATPQLMALYGRWAAGGWGLVITGNVMVDRRALEAPRNVVFDDAIGWCPAPAGDIIFLEATDRNPAPVAFGDILFDDATDGCPAPVTFDDVVFHAATDGCPASVAHDMVVNDATDGCPAPAALRNDVFGNATDGCPAPVIRRLAPVALHDTLGRDLHYGYLCVFLPPGFAGRVWRG